MNIITILCDTLRRDHVSAYTDGKPLNECWSKQAPAWSVKTPNIDRIAMRGVTFDNAYIGSTPCMPARRDIYTGRYEFLERGWGPLEDSDIDLPRQVSGQPNHSIEKMKRDGERISYLATDHFHLWEQGSGNYHMGYTGFDFVRGCEADNWRTDPIDFYCPDSARFSKTERHWRNAHIVRKTDDDYFSAQVLNQASDWLKLNHTHENFYMHLDIFDPHEPWDPPEDVLKEIYPEGYSKQGPTWGAPYEPWKPEMDEERMNFLRACYSAKVLFLDRYIGKLLDTMDDLDLWKDTVVILTSDHGTYNGDHDRMGKMGGTHQFDAVAHIPLLIAHPDPTCHGQHRKQLAQLVDLYPTVLSAVERPLPEMPEEKPIHGVDLLPSVLDADAPTREHAIMGAFGHSVTITDGDWILHQAPVEGNRPLFWHGHHQAKFIYEELGDYVDGRREVLSHTDGWQETWLSNKNNDMNELTNIASSEPSKVNELQTALKNKIKKIKAPDWQTERLGLI